MTFADDMAAAGNEVAVPPGNYDVEIVDAKAWHARNTGTPTAKLVFRVRSGPLKDASYDQILNLGNDVGRAVAKEALTMLGLDMAVRRELEELDTAMQGLIGVTANVTTAERNPPFRETQINTSQLPLTSTRPASAPSSLPAPAAPAAAGDDDIPF